MLMPPKIAQRFPSRSLGTLIGAERQLQARSRDRGQAPRSPCCEEGRTATAAAAKATAAAAQLPRRRPPREPPGPILGRSQVEATRPEKPIADASGRALPRDDASKPAVGAAGAIAGVRPAARRRRAPTTTPADGSR